jgi:hypothetical protein
MAFFDLLAQRLSTNPLKQAHAIRNPCKEKGERRDFWRAGILGMMPAVSLTVFAVLFGDSKKYREVVFSAVAGCAIAHNGVSAIT